MAKFCSLFSSSSGNSTYIGTSQGGILIDVGVSAKKTADALRNIGVEPDSIAAIFVTHEHSDHINGIRVFAERHGTKVYASHGTLAEMEDIGTITPKISADVIPWEGMEAGGMFIRPFKTPHDSRESTGYSIVTPDGKRLAVATDIGKVTDTVMNAIYGSDLVLLESNHDVGMLRNGPYPYFLKERILSNHGHLSNEACAETAVKLMQSGTTRFILGHLSKENNIPALAFETTRAAMKMAGAVENLDYLLSVAGDNNPVVSF
ncbi:MAG: MBL fold metallo-hydrolase [Ruminococcaceae bacterium]|nr:MBL fold metallo-hydrolase [Oscillospiraceae bacterium]